MSQTVTSPTQALSLILCGTALASACQARREVTRLVSYTGAALLVLLAVAGSVSAVPNPSPDSLLVVPGDPGLWTDDLCLVQPLLLLQLGVVKSVWPLNAGNPATVTAVVM